MADFIKAQFSSALACEVCQRELPAGSDVWLNHDDPWGMPRARCYPNCQEQPAHLAQQEAKMARFRRGRRR